MPNRLALAQSLYLRKHADNPVDWWTWGDEAIALARQTNRPIFLSIGYSSCHWCTVMEREAFSDSAIAHYLNTHFLPIKVDREERPDLDSLYMQALQLMIGQRGWPLNVFLSPDDLIPFYGGTYFPIESRYGKPAFLKVLKSLHNIYENDLGQLASIKSQVLTELKPAVENNSHQAPLTEALTKDLLERGLRESGQALIPNISGASFPMMPYGLATLQGSQLISKTVLDLGQICRQRALDLVLGGIFDHVAGGFHRYT
ncbi:MAG: thioredoxin domain-containing protein, partial [Phormidesmis sp.]